MAQLVVGEAQERVGVDVPDWIGATKLTVGGGISGASSGARLAINVDTLVVDGRAKLDDVAAVSTRGTLAVVVLWIVVGASPLEVHVVAQLDVHAGGEEVVLDTGVYLHDVAALATHLDIVDGTSDARRSVTFKSQVSKQVNK